MWNGSGKGESAAEKAEARGARPVQKGRRVAITQFQGQRKAVWIFPPCANELFILNGRVTSFDFVFLYLAYSQISSQILILRGFVASWFPKNIIIAPAIQLCILINIYTGLSYNTT